MVEIYKVREREDIEFRYDPDKCKLIRIRKTRDPSNEELTTWETMKEVSSEGLAAIVEEKRASGAWIRVPHSVYVPQTPMVDAW